MNIPSSTLISYATSSIQYIWDTTTGILYTQGGLIFFVALTIISGVIAIGISLLKGLLKG